MRKTKTFTNKTSESYLKPGSDPYDGRSYNLEKFLTEQDCVYKGLIFYPILREYQFSPVVEYDGVLYYCNGIEINERIKQAKLKSIDSLGKYTFLLDDDPFLEEFSIHIHSTFNDMSGNYTNKIEITRKKDIKKIIIPLEDFHYVKESLLTFR